MRYIAKSKLLVFLLALAATMTGAATDQTTEKVVLIVAKVRRADYEGNRAALKQLYGDLAPTLKTKLSHPVLLIGGATVAQCAECVQRQHR